MLDKPSVTEMYPAQINLLLQIKYIFLRTKSKNVALAGLELGDPSASASQVLGFTDLCHYAQLLKLLH